MVYDLDGEMQGPSERVDRDDDGDSPLTYLTTPDRDRLCQHVPTRRTGGQRKGRVAIDAPGRRVVGVGGR